MVCLLYIFYYGGGDTIGYFQSAETLSEMLFKDQDAYFSILSGNLSTKNLYRFTDFGMDFPHYFKDPQSFTVVRITSPLLFLSGFSFFATTLIFAWLSYSGIWRLFLLLNELFPNMEKKFAIAVLYMPSLLFWGSAILKDTVTFSAACWFTYAIYMFFIKREKRKTFFAVLIFAAYIILSIKPYILIALMPGTTIWILFSRIGRIDNAFIRVLISPAIIVVGLGIVSTLMGALSENLGDFGSVDKALDKAIVTQKDLTREAYGKNSFDIGEIDPSIGGLIRKFPVSVMYGLYGPFLWNASNPVMLLSALENTFLLLFTIKVLLTGGIFSFFRRIFNQPFLIFCFVFAIFFSFALGLTTANFGALVRYKIPVIPFFLSLLYILDNLRTSEAFEKKTNNPETIQSQLKTNETIPA